MKVIFIKDHPKGKKHEIKEFVDGYAKNFLIKNKIALPFNKSNKKHIDMIHKDEEAIEEQKIYHATLLKNKIESLLGVFYIKIHNNKLYGSITKKQIMKFLLSNKIFGTDNYQITMNKITTPGIKKILINLHKKVQATLTIEVKIDGK